MLASITWEYSWAFSDVDSAFLFLHIQLWWTVGRPVLWWAWDLPSHPAQRPLCFTFLLSLRLPLGDLLLDAEWGRCKCLGEQGRTWNPATLCSKLQAEGLQPLKDRHLSPSLQPWCLRTMTSLQNPDLYCPPKASGFRISLWYSLLLQDPARSREQNPCWFMCLA